MSEEDNNLDDDFDDEFDEEGEDEFGNEEQAIKLYLVKLCLLMNQAGSSIQILVNPY